MSRIQSAERVSHLDASDNFVYQRSALAYREAAKMVSGCVLEIGTGSGYGIDVISPCAQSFTTIDKFDCRKDISDCTNVEFHRMTVPPMPSIASSSMDYVISFQVIEHIRDDFGLLAEIYRVLKPGGRLIITTPNRLMSLTRNPWHVREYTPSQFTNLLGAYFPKVESMGVFGNQKVMDYYEQNRLSVRKIQRLDFLSLSRWLPRPLLRLPYDIANRRNRRKLLTQNTDLTTSIAIDDYSIAPADDTCFDLFYIAEK